MPIPDPPPPALVLFVNFHHVRPANPAWCPGLPFVEVGAFERQLDLLARRFDFPHPDRVLQLLSRSEDGQSRPLCVLTFDDGLADHVAHVGPRLAARGISGVFNVNTGPWQSRRLLSVHQAHLLAGAFTYRALAEEFEEAAHLCGVAPRLADVDSGAAASQYRYDDPATARIKYYLNAVVPQALRSGVVSRVFATRLDNEAELAASHYLDPCGLRDLVAMGQVIGLHGHEHLHLASASPEECRSDLTMNLEFLRSSLERDVPRFDWISYPYGGPASYSETVIGIARSLGCRAGLTMRRGVNHRNRSLDCMRLARIDTNDAPGGRSPLPLEELFEE